MAEKPQNLLTIDIIDYIIDNGCPKIINLIAQKHFLDTFLNLLKSETNAGVENQKKYNLQMSSTLLKQLISHKNGQKNFQIIIIIKYF